MADWMPWAKPFITEQIIFQRRVRALRQEFPSKDDLVTLQRQFKRMEEAFTSTKEEVVKLQERITTLEAEGTVLKDFKEHNEARLVAPEQDPGKHVSAPCLLRRKGPLLYSSEIYKKEKCYTMVCIVTTNVRVVYQQLSQIRTMAETIGKTEKRPLSHLTDAAKQGQRTLRGYLDDFNSIGANCEDELVTAFINGMNSRHYRAALEAALARVGRRWSNLKHEVVRMLEDATRRTKNRRSYDRETMGFLMPRVD